MHVQLFAGVTVVPPRVPVARRPVCRRGRRAVRLDGHGVFLVLVHFAVQVGHVLADRPFGDAVDEFVAVLRHPRLPVAEYRERRRLPLVERQLFQDEVVLFQHFDGRVPPRQAGPVGVVADDRLRVL